MTAAEKRLYADQVSSADALRSKREKKELEHWRAQPFMTDAFVDPFSKLGNDGGTPSYMATIEFINGKLKPFMSLGFGSRTKRMIFRETFEDAPGMTAVFDPQDLNTAVRYETYQRQSGLELLKLGRIILEAKNLDPKISVYSIVIQEAGSWRIEEGKVPRLVIGETISLDALDTKRVADALNHLIAMFGGKAEPF